MKLLIIIASITTVICTYLFQEPTVQIHLARANCTKNSSIEETCYDLCALESSMMLTPEGDAINVKEFGPFHQKYAKECWTLKSKPTCEEAHDFLGCLYKKSMLAFEESMKACKEKYPVKDIEKIEVTAELLAENKNLACQVACHGERMAIFNDDDTINMDCFNPYIPFDFDAKQAAKECEDSNKGNDKCLKRSTIFTCLSRSFEKALQEEFTRKQSELTKV